MRYFSLSLLLFFLALVLGSCNSSNRIVGYWYGEGDEGYYVAKFEKDGTCYRGWDIKLLENIDSQLTEKEYYEVAQDGSICIDASEPVVGMPLLFMGKKKGKTVLYDYFLDEVPNEDATEKEYKEWYDSRLETCSYMTKFKPGRTHKDLEKEITENGNSSREKTAGNSKKSRKDKKDPWGSNFDENDILWFDTHNYLNYTFEDKEHLYYVFHSYSSTIRNEGTLSVIIEKERENRSNRIGRYMRCTYKKYDNDQIIISNCSFFVYGDSYKAHPCSHTIKPLIFNPITKEIDGDIHIHESLGYPIDKRITGMSIIDFDYSRYNRIKEWL